MIEPSYQLIVRTGPIPGQVFALEKGEVFIGREMTNDIVINDAEISRRHARIVWQPAGFMIEDLGSTNGTFINGQRLMNPALMRPGDMMMFGEHVTLSFEEVRFDENATAVVERPPAPVVSTPVPQPVPQPVAQPAAQPMPRPQPVQPQPIPAYVPPPPPIYAAQAPVTPKAVKPKKKFPMWLVIILILLFLSCVCLAVVLWYIDANYLWCQVMPFIPGCP
jgi:hypothetical protein